MAEIPFWFHDRPKWVSGIGRSTTCQDVLHSLLRAHVEKKKSSRNANEAASSNSASSEADLRQTSMQLALVEQWRGVERPLSGSSKILKLWSAWGEEREQVRFVVKRISSSLSAAEAATSSSSTLPSRMRKTRRRNSRLCDTVHPAALRSRSEVGLAAASKAGLKSAEIERLMRIILTQGETIHSQLKKLQERELEIDGIEQEVHASRTKTAGKDYLLNAYLKDSSPTAAAAAAASSSSASSSRSLSFLAASAVGHSGVKKKALAKSDSVPECLSEMVDALNRVHGLNEQIEMAEERVNDLNCKIRSASASSASSSPTSEAASLEEMDAARGELERLLATSDKVGREMDANRRMISSMQNAFDERQAMVSRLERDVNVVESEGMKLEMELQRIVTQRMQKEFSGELMIGGRGRAPDEADEADDDEEDVEEELLNEILGMSDDRLSNSQLYEDKQRQNQLYSRLQKLHIKTTSTNTDLPLTELQFQARSDATGSPGSSSGNSSGSSNSENCEKSVRFSDRDLIMATPELPPLPPDDFQQQRGAVSRNLTTAGNSSGLSEGSNSPAVAATDAAAAAKSFAKSILKSVDPSGDLDSNSDTGLSSLHSSSDEGTYVLDTLV